MLHLNSLLGRRTFKAVLGLCLFSTASVFAEVTVSGDVDPFDPSTWTSTTSLRIGYTGSGTLEITNGSSASNGDARLGYGLGSTGLATVDGAGSTWTNGPLYVGREGSGTLNILNGGLVISGFFESVIAFGSDSAGAVTVDGEGSALRATSFTVGRLGNGTLNITHAGTVVGYYKSTIASGSGSTGVVTVDGVGSTWTNNNGIYLGGQGTLNITDGGTVAVMPGEVKIGGTQGEIHFEQGTLTTEILLAGAEQLTGIGTINTTELISDVDLTFESVDDFNQTIILDDLPGQNIAINLDFDGQAEHLGAGYAGKGSLSIRNGVQVSSTDGFIGYQPGSAGEAVIDGVGSIWEVEGYGGLYVGLHGNGRLEITNGGQINALVGYISRQDGSTGVVTVDGAGSMLTCSRTFHIAFGDYGKIGTNGTLNVTNGGVVNCNSHSYIAYDLQSLGLVTVDGAGSIWNNIGDLYIAHGGAGTLNILNGGAVNSTGPGYIAFESDSTGIITVDGSGSVWNNTDGLYVGKDGGGTLHIANGGKVISNKSYLGYGLGSTGKVTVDGAGSTWIGDLSIGYEGSGSLNITNGGKVSSGSCHIGYTSTATGVVTVDGTGSTWTNMHDLSVGDYESSGTLNITNGGVVSNRDGYLGYFDDSTGVVTVEGAGSTWMNSGSLHLGGKGSAMLTIARGGLVSSSRIFLNAYGNNSFVNMASGGMLALMGDAGYSLSSFLGLIEGTDSIRFWDESISDWRPLRDATYGKEYSLVYQTEGTFAGYTVLTVGVIPGDYNGDRAVGLADYTVWADFFGQTGDDLPADGNEDGLVDMADYAIWADHYGNKVDVDSDTTPPSVVDSLVPHESVYNTGDFLVFHVAWNEPLMVTGTPQLNLLIGEEERKASYYYWDNGNAFQWVTFVYRIQPGDGGVLSVSHEIDLNGGSIADAAGNPAELFVNFASTEGVVIDTTVYPISGDYNGDWKVDLADYSLWADSFGQTGDDLPADGNDDGVVDIADYTIWANHFGQTAN